MGSSPDLVNSQGQKLSDADKDVLYGKFVSTGWGAVRMGGPDEATRNKMLHNWLVGDVLPKPTDPTEVIAKAQQLAPAKLKAGAGSGMSGLFGFAKFIGGTALPQLPQFPGMPKFGGG